MKATVEDIIREEISEAEKRAAARVMPLLRAEFARLKKRHPRLKRVIFGHGTYVIDYEARDTFNNGFPKSFAKFETMLSVASGFQTCFLSVDDDLS